MHSGLGIRRGGFCALQAFTQGTLCILVAGAGSGVGWLTEVNASGGLPDCIINPVALARVIVDGVKSMLGVACVLLLGAPSGCQSLDTKWECNW